MLLLLIMVTGEDELAEREGDVDSKFRMMRRWIVLPSVTVACSVSEFVEAANLADAALEDRL